MVTAVREGTINVQVKGVQLVQCLKSVLNV